MIFAKITGTGSYLPEKSLDNHALAEIVETSDQWITQRVGIETRHVANERETTAYMAHASAQKAIANAKLSSDDIGLIIVATGTGDYLMPSTGSMLQQSLKVPDCPAFDINAACSGFVYAIDIAKQYLENGVCKHALVVASERMTRTLNWKDRTTCVLFGDGAGAVVLSKSDTPGIITSSLHTNGKGIDMLNVKSPLAQELYGKHTQDAFLHMEGNKVFKQAVSALTELANTLLDKARLTAQDIDRLVPHQANYRILEATAKKLNLSMEKVVITLREHGNTSAASIPLALDYAVKNNMVKPGQTILSEAFGAGLVWGGFIAKL